MTTTWPASFPFPGRTPMTFFTGDGLMPQWASTGAEGSMVNGWK
jgi:hypothetical protein